MGLVVITGMSGAGKSRAIIALEDIGYYCVDNLPPKLIPDLVRPYLSEDGTATRNIAIVVDVRSKEMFKDFFQSLPITRGGGSSRKSLRPYGVPPFRKGGIGHSNSLSSRNLRYLAIPPKIQTGEKKP